MLIHFDIEKPVILHTDASEEAVGVIVLQKKSDGKHPVSYASRVLTSVERSYITTEKESLVFIWALKKFHP